MDTLAGKTLFITGGSRGIGLAIALRAARDGANVAIAAKPQGALALSRRLVRGDPARIWARVEEEGRLFTERLMSEEAKQAFQAFMQKRK